MDILKFIKDNNLTAYRLAKEMNQNPCAMTIRNWIRGTYRPSPRIQKRLEKYILSKSNEIQK